MALYNDYYGLTDRPFQLTPDPRFYFDSATHRKAMAYLGYGLAQGEGFIVVTGEVGAGKTTLVGHLMDTLDPHRLGVATISSTQLGGDDMLRMIAQAFGVTAAGPDKAHLLDRIEAYLQEQARAGRKTLLVVDEAQNLPDEALEELRMLSNFQDGSSALLQILLLGQPEFRERLQASVELEQLRQRIIAAHHLDAMGPNEIGPYIVHRLSLVGWVGEPSFTPDAYSAMYRFSGGLPRKLNALASRTLLLGAIEKLSVIDGHAVDIVIADFEAQPIPLNPVIEEEPPAPIVRAVAPEDAPRETAIPADMAARLAAIEARLDEQDDALRRMLVLLAEWVERDEAIHADAIRHSVG